MTNFEWLNLQPSYALILKKKQDYYGKTQFSYEAAADEYARKYHKWMQKRPN